MSRHSVPSDIEEQITTPHSHESVNQPPLWLIWQELEPGDGFYPVCISNTEKDARISYNQIAGPEGSRRRARSRIVIERVPANHIFASTMYDRRWSEHVRGWD